MRVALIGWDIDEPVAGSLARLGVEVVAFTRWHADQPTRETRDDFIVERCPNQLGGDGSAEADGFRDSVLQRAHVEGHVSARFDVVHAMDAMSVPAANSLADVSPGTLRIASVSAREVDADFKPRISDCVAFWIFDHPWTADRWIHRNAERSAATAIIPSADSLLIGPGEPGDRHSVILWLPALAEVDMTSLVEALVGVANAPFPISPVVLGSSRAAHLLRRRLGATSVAPHSFPEVADPTRERWNALVGSASALLVSGPTFADEPAAWAAWLAGVPVLALCPDPATRIHRLREALEAPTLLRRGIDAAAARASGRLTPEAVASAWLRVYLDAPWRPSHRETDREEPAQRRAGRSRLSLVAIGPREVHASWHVRPSDRSTALTWLGHDAVRGETTLRLYDVTDIAFDGQNAHGYRDIEVGPFEQHRSIRLDAPGRSFAASLGVRSARGYFHPLAHADIVHLPRECETESRPSKRLRALPRK